MSKRDLSNNEEFSKNIFRLLPKEMKSLIDNQNFKVDSIGKSDSHIFLFDNHLVLKVEAKSKEADNEYKMLNWLQGKLSVPKVRGFFTDEINNFLLMERVKGKMICNSTVFPDEAKRVKMLAKGLKQLWEVDITNCPTSVGLEVKLNTAYKNVKENKVDIADAEPGTFGKNGFKNPMELYQHLEENRLEEDSVFVHGDYCLPNIFVEENKITAFLDFGRSGVGDKWQDIALAVRSLQHTLEDAGKEELYPYLYQLLFKELEIESDEEKIHYYILLDELF